MGWQVVKQPDGRLAIWSSVVGGLIARDLDAEECAGEFAAEIGRDFADRMRKVEKIIGWVLDGTPAKAYHQFTMMWEDVVNPRAECERLAEEDDGG
jgi:hypothetical protein